MTAKACDATRAGQVLMRAPEGAGDFSDLVWVIASVLGNRAGVRGVDVQRAVDGGSLSGYVTAENAQYVRDVAAALGWRLYELDGTYCNTWGMLGETQVDVTWLTPRAADGASESPQLGDEEAGS